MAQDTGVTAVQEQVLDAIRTTQEATLNVCRTWSQAFSPVSPNMFDVFVTPKVDSFNGFSEELWASQRDFTVAMCEVVADMGRAVPDVVKRSAAAAETARAAASPENAKARD